MLLRIRLDLHDMAIYALKVIVLVVTLDILLFSSSNKDIELFVIITFFYLFFLTKLIISLCIQSIGLTLDTYRNTIWELAL